MNLKRQKTLIKNRKYTGGKKDTTYFSKKLKEFGLKEKNSHYENLNDFIVNKETGEIVYVPYGAEKLVIPASVKVLKSYFMRGLKAKEIGLKST